LIPLTQEFFGQMLGARRTTVTRSQNVRTSDEETSDPRGFNR